MTAQEKILRHIQCGGKLTQLQALNMFDNFRLSDAIFKLKKKGYDIKTQMIRTKTNKRIAQYFMEVR